MIRKTAARAAFVTALTAGLVRADVIHVDDDAAPGGDGTSWAQAFRFLADGVDAAGVNDEVRVAEGTYRPDQSAASPQGTGPDGMIEIARASVIVRGGFAGLGAVDPDAHAPDLYPTVVTGDLGGERINDLIAIDDGGALDVAHIRFERSRRNAIELHDGALTVRDCVFADHDAGFGSYTSGAIVAAAGSQRTIIERCAFTSNISSMHVVAADIIDCVFEANDSGPYGGIAVKGVDLLLDGCTFRNNVQDCINASLFGPGCDGGPVIMRDCEFLDNESDGVIVRLMCEADGSRLENCAFERNGITDDGTPILDVRANGTSLKGCSFTDNTAGHFGVAWFSAGDCTVSASTFTGNHAPTWSAINSAHPIDIKGSTFTQNVGGSGVLQLRAVTAGASTVSGCTFVESSGTAIVAEHPIEVIGSIFNGGGDVAIHLAPTAVSSVVTACTFADNTGSGTGGAIHAEAGDVSVLYGVFNDNTAVTGGAIHAASTAFLHDCQFAGNGATGDGGALHMAAATIADCTFNDNYAGRGGAAYLSGGSVERCVFQTNTAETSGGGVQLTGGFGALAHSRFLGNHAATGGAISVDALNGAGRWPNLLLVANTATDAGRAISVDGSDASFFNATIIDPPGATTTLDARNAGELHILASLLSGTDVHAAADASSAINIFSSLDGSGATPTFVDPDGPDDDPTTPGDNDYRLAPGSAGIDAANSNFAPTLTDIDIEGNARYIDDPATTDTGSGFVSYLDMGAFEFQPAPLTADLDGDGDVDIDDLLALLAAWGTTGADLNGSGTTDVDDLLILLSAFAV